MSTMTPELLMLALSVVLGFVHIIVSACATTRQYGSRWNLSARDAPMPPLDVVAGRLQRALHNFLETFPLFAVAVLIADAINRHGWLSLWGSQIYFYARVIYLPVYAAGLPVVRTIVWSVATLGIVMVLIDVF
ncbi:MAG TPA: MAPEG family protein [Xanthobacteraceae bacterium]|jgi:uncharacterized MAPEG superfamily protein|nr:MAPEG family protein [Xanthobacteraceae bacterium]